MFVSPRGGRTRSYCTVAPVVQCFVRFNFARLEATERCWRALPVFGDLRFGLDVAALLCEPGRDEQLQREVTIIVGMVACKRGATSRHPRYDETVEIDHRLGQPKRQRRVVCGS